MKKYFSFMFLIIFSLVYAQEMGLNEAKKVALERNSDYLAKKYAYEKEKFATINSFLSFFPQGSFSYVYKKRDEKGTFAEDNMENYLVSLSQPIFSGGKIFYGYLNSSNSKKIALYNYLNQKILTMKNLEIKYFALLEAEKSLEINSEVVKVARENLKKSEVRYKVGTLSEADYLNMQADLASKEVSCLQSESSYQTSKIDLQEYLREKEEIIPIAFDFSEYDSLVELINSYDLEKVYSISEKVVEYGLANNYSIKINELSVKIAKNNKSISQWANLPTISLGYEYEKQRYYTKDFSDPSNSVSLSLSIPIFPLVDKYFSYREAKSNYKSVENSFSSLKSTTKNFIKSTTILFISSAKNIKSSRLSLAYAEKNYLVSKAKFDKGLLSTNDLIDASIVLQRAKLALNTSLYSFMKNKAELQELLSLENEKNLIDFFS